MYKFDYNDKLFKLPQIPLVSGILTMLQQITCFSASWISVHFPENKPFEITIKAYTEKSVHI